MGRHLYVLVNNRAEGHAPLTVEALSGCARLVTQWLPIKFGTSSRPMVPLSGVRGSAMKDFEAPVYVLDYRDTLNCGRLATLIRDTSGQEKTMEVHGPP